MLKMCEGREDCSLIVLFYDTFIALRSNSEKEKSMSLERGRQQKNRYISQLYNSACRYSSVAERSLFVLLETLMAKINQIEHLV